MTVPKPPAPPPGASRAAPSVPAPGGVGDVVAATVLVLGAALAVRFAPEGSPLRLALVAPALFLVPGYLLLQALIVPARSPRARALHGLLGVGLSPALVGLLALSTAIVPGGFRPDMIVAVVTGTCLLLAGVAAYRRQHVPTPEATRPIVSPEPRPAPAPPESGRRPPGSFVARLRVEPGAGGAASPPAQRDGLEPRTDPPTVVGAEAAPARGPLD